MPAGSSDHRGQKVTGRRSQWPPYVSIVQVPPPSAVDSTVQCKTVSESIGAKSNLYCEAIELVCGGSPKVCFLVERKARHRVKLEQWQLKPVWISGLYNTSVQSWMKSMETICSSRKSLYRAFSLYEAHQIRRITTGEPTLLE